MAADILIIGIGNPIRGDDGLGWQAAGMLENALVGSDLDLDVLTVQQLTMDLVDEISAARLVVFIDAEIGDLSGQIKQQEIVASTSLAGPGSHFFDPHTLLSAVQALYGNHPPALLFSLSTNSFEYREELSHPVQLALQGFITQIGRTIRTYNLPERIVS
jgi:hydrogenase maturation protease